MSYVQAGQSIATNNIPSVVAEMHKAHKERQERIRAAAYAERVKEAAEVDDQQVAILERSWEGRGKLPPIPNAAIAEAAEIIHPRFIPGQIETILRAVLVHFPDVGMSDLKSARRTDRVVRPRQIAMYLIKQHTNRTLPDIGRRIGGRDHTTVLYAVRKIEAEIKVNAILAEQIKKIDATIEEMMG